MPVNPFVAQEKPTRRTSIPLPTAVAGSHPFGDLVPGGSTIARDLKSTDAWEKALRGKARQYFVGNAEDRLAEIIHVAGEVSEAPAVACVVTASMEVSQAGPAIKWSVGLADYIANVSGIPTAVVTSNCGPYGVILWISNAESIAIATWISSGASHAPGLGADSLPSIRAVPSNTHREDS